MPTTYDRLVQPVISLPCDIESRRATPERAAAWHKDCPYPERCACPAHARDARPVKC